MDISLDQTLESSDKHRDGLEDEATNELTQGGEGQQAPLETYPFASNDNGQVTYRVVQVGGSDDNQQATLSIVSANGIPNILTQGTSGNGSPQVAIVTNPFNDGGETSAANAVSEGQAAKFAYFPSVSGPSTTGQDLSAQTDQEHQVPQGQFYVMMSPQDMIQSAQSSKHQIAPRSQFGIQKVDNGRNTVVVRDTTRRVQHNEVERRRRDKINNWIVKLSKMVPDCAGDQSKQGQSKGGILAKTCEYILDLQTSNQQYADHIKEYERLQVDVEVLRLQLEEKKQENLILHQTLRSHGLAVDIKNTSS